MASAIMRFACAAIGFNVRLTSRALGLAQNCASILRIGNRMDTPVKHHFNPAFSLKPWALTDGRLCEMKRIKGKVVPRRTHPNATGFQKNLYRTDGVPAEDEQHLELNVMRPLDTAADLALKKILSGDSTPWDSAERSAWTRYILSVMFRNPQVVQEVRKRVREMWGVGIQALKKNYADRRLPTGPTTFEDYYARTHPAAAEIGATNLLTQIIDNDRLGPTIFNMHWSRVPLRRSKVSLLNSDRPLDRPLGLNDPQAYIAFPVDPEMLFIASNDPTLARSIFEGDHTVAAKKMNKTVVSQAREFVWGVDDRQLAFVQKHMGTAPERAILSARQRQKALDAARGPTG
jgi:hypothetical protein